jgi:hypothetical protein
MYQMLYEFDDLFDSEKGLAKIETYLKRNTLEAEAYPRASLMYATIKFVNYGEIVTYVNDARETIEFSPTLEINEQREKYLWSKEALSWTKDTMRSNIYFWPVVLVVNLLLGSFIPAWIQVRSATSCGDAV